MEIKAFFGEGFDCNSYLITEGEDAVLIDCAVAPDVLLRELEARGAALGCIVLTHGHFDHISSLDEVRDLTGAPAAICEMDAEMLTDARKNGFADFFVGDFSARPAEKTLRDGDVITVGGITLEVIHTPGHSRGSICLRCGDALFVGDTLFANNIGRSDLYGGDGATLFRSLKKIAGLPGSLDVYPGHGPLTTLGREVKMNYYIRDALDFE